MFDCLALNLGLLFELVIDCFGIDFVMVLIVIGVLILGVAFACWVGVLHRF